MTDTKYDYVIIGAGIAGLYTAFQIHNKYPNAKIAILESLNRIGGRLHTIHHDGSTFDAGGARFNTKQYRILCLIKELGLESKIVPITNDIKYISYKPAYNSRLETIFPTIDDFIVYMKKYINDNNISNDTLVNTTIIGFTKKYLSKDYPTLDKYLIDIYPYYSELKILNAFEGLNLFRNEFSSNTQYMVLKGGLDQLTTTIYNKLKQNTNIHLDLNTRAESIIKLDTSTTPPYIEYKITSGTKEYTTTTIILAIPKPKLLDLKYLTKNKTLLSYIKSVQTEPLYRIYAKYPINTKTGKSWFDGLTKVATNLPIKYVIPIDSTKGVIMISYTDSKFSKFWMDKVGDNTFETTLNTYLKCIFPNLTIPKPKWFKHYPWDFGAGYWKKGYDRNVILPKMIQPFPKERIFICGENYSSHQAWVEGSLETADLVLAKLKININHNKPCKISRVNNIINTLKQKSTNHANHNRKTHKHTPISPVTGIAGGGNGKYKLNDVAKHNKKTDAWIVINNIVADITDWIPNHPGGDIIMKGVGKNATQLFKSIGHDATALKMLNKYKIGTLA
jgi:cytochrome b involved in lipid metabolism/monoamine oxidase